MNSQAFCGAKVRASRQTANRSDQVIVAFLPLLLGGELLLWIVLLPVGMRGDADFAMFYTAGSMVRAGYAHQIYNYDAETRFQNELVSKTPAPYTHLPYEALLFAPLSALPYRVAYCTFLLLNLGLATSTLFLMPRADVHWLAAATVASFFPVSAAIADGQDSIILLVITCVAWFLFGRKREWLAGNLLALGLFRFQIVLPIAGLMFLWRRGRFVAGFVMSAAVLLVLSGWLAGFDQLAVYGSHLLSLSTMTRPETGYSISQSQARRMVSLRALLANTLPSTHIAQAITLLASIALLLWVARLGQVLGRKYQFALAVALSVLVSYHLFVYDLTILLIPMIAALELAKNEGSRTAHAAVLIPLLATPVGILWRPFLLALPLLAFLYMIARAFRGHAGKSGAEFTKASVAVALQ
jgi:hypothetical protein